MPRKFKIGFFVVDLDDTARPRTPLVETRQCGPILVSDEAVEAIRAYPARAAALEAMAKDWPADRDEWTREQHDAYLLEFAALEASVNYIDELLIAGGDIVSRDCRMQIEQYLQREKAPAAAE